MRKICRCGRTLLLRCSYTWQLASGKAGKLSKYVVCLVHCGSKPASFDYEMVREGKIALKYHGFAPYPFLPLL